MKNKRFKLRPQAHLNNSGQALVEYILLLIISVVLVMGLMLQFFKPMQIFIKDYMGTYVQCLLDTGELPSLNSGTSRISDTSCIPSWERAVANGKGDPNYLSRASTTGREGVGKNRGSSSTSNSGSGGGGSGKDRNRGQDNGGSEKAGAGPYAGSSSRSGQSNFSPERATSGADSGSASGQNGRSVVINLNEAKGDRFFGARNIGANQNTNRSSIVDMSSLSEQEKKKIQKEPRGVARVIASDTNPKQNKKIIIKPQVAKTKVDTEESPMIFGNYFRIFFMICIIILLVILLGGQALQISKGWEK